MRRGAAGARGGIQAATDRGGVLGDGIASLIAVSERHGDDAVAAAGGATFTLGEPRLPNLQDVLRLPSFPEQDQGT